MKVTKDMLVGSLIDEAPTLTAYFLNMGMHCLGCPASRGETIEEACMVHGVDADSFIDQLNEALAAQ